MIEFRPLGLRLFTESYRPVLELLRANQVSLLDMAKMNQNSGEEIATETVNALIPEILANAHATVFFSPSVVGVGTFPGLLANDGYGFLPALKESQLL